MTLAIKKLKEIQTNLHQVELTSHDFKNLLERTKIIAKRQFGENEVYLKNIEKIEKELKDAFWGYNSEFPKDLKDTVIVMIDELEFMDETNSAARAITNSPSEDNLNIFIVHGHNEVMKIATARMLEKLGLSPIILHEKANQGDTIIEKFTRYSDVGFAVVLLSADDIGYSKKQDAKSGKYRARQNVIFELGFFTARLGRKKVVALFENIKNFELPSDIDGVIYIPYKDGESSWQFDLSKELLEVGFQIDTNKLLK